MVRELAVPFVVVECDLAFFESLFRRFAFAPGFAAVKFVELPFGFSVPSVEQFARVAPLWLAVALILRQHLFRQLARVFLILLVGNFDLLLGIFERNRLEEFIDTT